MENFKDVFADGLKTIQSVKAKLSVEEYAQPKFFKPPRSVPLAIKAAVERELGKLESEGVVDFSDPCCRCAEKDGQVHIHSGYKEEIFFAKLALTHAYQQVILEYSPKFVTINTYRRLCHYTRLPFDIASAPAIFQKRWT